MDYRRYTSLVPTSDGQFNVFLHLGCNTFQIGPSYANLEFAAKIRGIVAEGLREEFQPNYAIQMETD